MEEKDGQLEYYRMRPHVNPLVNIDDDDEFGIVGNSRKRLS